MTTVEDQLKVEDYHLLKEPMLLMIAEAASSIDTALESYLEVNDHNSEHFSVVPWKKVVDFCAPITAHGVIGAALLMLEDLNLYQVPVEFDKKTDTPKNLWVRRIPALGPFATVKTCAPMYHKDVRAIIACVGHGSVSAVNELTRFGLAEIRRWAKGGVKANREDVRRVLLGLLDDYSKKGATLKGVALNRQNDVKEGAEVAVVRRAWIGEQWFDLLEKVKAVQTLRTPVVEQKIVLSEIEKDWFAEKRKHTVADVVEEGLKLHAQGSLCEKCKKRDSKGRRLCEVCEDALISQSGAVKLTKGDIPTFDTTGLNGAVLPVVGKAAFDAGITSKDDYDYVAEQISNLVATFDQYDLEMDEAGIFVQGINLEKEPERAQHRNPARSDGVVVAAGLH
jgi:hypothetical protein